MGRGISRRSLGRGVRNSVVGLTVARFASGSQDVLATPANQVTTADGRVYDAYIEVVPKFGQFYTYTCEFDAAWVVLATFGHEPAFEEMLEIVGHDVSIEPWWEETANGFVIYGGDIATAFSGDYMNNLLARASGAAFQPLFAEFDLTATPVATREEVQAALDLGDLVWTKATVDFLPWADTRWITPDGTEIPTVLGNDHAVVVSGYNQDVVVITDPLGPTSTNWERPYEYEVPWDTFLGVWEAQHHDGLAVGPARGTGSTTPEITALTGATSPIIESTGGS